MATGTTIAKTAPDPNDELLVAIINSKADFAILQEHGWYRVPVASTPRRWPPRWLAFYQTKVFGDEAYKVTYFGRVRRIHVATRQELFPEEPSGSKSDRRYYQIFLEALERRQEPIVSRKWRRIVFIPTTFAKFIAATEINDLYDDSPLEDALWAEFKRLNIHAERQMDVKAEQSRFMLDFAIYCAQGKINVETDGDTWHADRERIPQDNERNNALGAQGWHVLRFNGQQIRESLADYCLPQIVQTVNRLGGLADDGTAPPTLAVSPEGIAQQMTLFEDTP
ncbi:MAG: endonuclease domain-containing protein [Armatimonadota bacterium]|nr:endonuclease domain-containing protein [Armatimonadota bacterium]